MLVLHDPLPGDVTKLPQLIPFLVSTKTEFYNKIWTDGAIRIMAM